MSWGGYWMFYSCPQCEKKYKWELDALSDSAFGTCPVCSAQGSLMGESGKNAPQNPEDFLELP